MLFASFAFLQFVIMRLCNQAGRGLLSDDFQEKIYLYIQIFAVAGFVFHGMTHKFVRKSRVRLTLSLCALAVCVPGASVLMFSSSASVIYLIAAAVTVVCIGFVGGAVYVRMAYRTKDGAKAGVCMGAGYSFAILTQYLLQLQFSVPVLLAAVSAISFAALGYMLVCIKDEPEESAEEVKPAAKGVRKLVFALVITLSMLLFISYYNSYIHHLQIQSGYTEYNVYSWPRLLMIPAVISFGILGDIKNGKYLPISTLCTAVLSLLNAVLTEVTGAYWLNMCLYYVSLSAVISYYNLTFWKLAPKTRMPGLWSSAGRVTDSLAVILTFIIPISSLSPVAVLSLNIAALAVIMILTAINGDFNLGAEPQKTDEPPAAKDTPDGALESVKEKYGLTQSEFRVLKQLVLTEDKQAAIAESLSVKIRTVQANVTSIYRKTGVSTRSGLVSLCRDESDNK